MTRPRTQVGKVSLDGARPDAHELGHASDGSASFNEGAKDVHLALRRVLASERFLQTYDVSLTSFLAVSDGFDANRLVSITFQFDGAGAAYLDDVAFESAVSL